MPENQEPQEERAKYTPQDVIDYRPIVLALEYNKEKNQEGLEKVVSQTLHNITGGTKDRNRENIRKSLNTESFIKVFAGEYQNALAFVTIRDLRELYSDSFKGYFSEENLPKVNAVFDSDEKYGDFVNRYNALAEKAKSPTNNFTEEEKKKAQEELQELDKIRLPLEEFEKIELDKIKGPIDKDSLKKRLNDMYKEPEKKEGEEAGSTPQ